MALQSLRLTSHGLKQITTLQRLIQRCDHYLYRDRLHIEAMPQYDTPPKRQLAIMLEQVEYWFSIQLGRTDGTQVLQVQCRLGFTDQDRRKVRLSR